jgi:predicted TIM-barrel fold metal-dependent hydrolase
MNEATHDPDAGLAPAFAAPAQACDAHFHVFGPPERYAYDASDLRYRPPHAPLADYLKEARSLGFERFVLVQPSADVTPFAQALIAAAPEQLIWGSDYPHLSFHDRVGTIGLYNKLADWADAAARRRILADNPARLFGFA